MNRSFIYVMLFTVLVLIACGGSATVTAQPASAVAAAELSFSFSRQSGSASNQFAVWIEDAQGHHVKTLYATRFTANGGWKRRETSIPLWVKRSGLADMTKDQIDSLTGATPRTGTLTYHWDGTDSRNITLSQGDYVICLEGTLRGNNQVIYRAPIKLGQGPASPEVTVEYIGSPPGDERSMISAVVVKTLR